MTRSISSKDYEKLRILLVQARKRLSLSQYDVAKLLGRPQSYISKYERGERRLDVIEFLEVAEALKVSTHSILAEIREEALTKTILQQWDITPEDLTTIVQLNPSLRGILFGYVAELKFEQLWLQHPDISTFHKHDDHSRKGKGDRVITYKGELFIIEVKSLQTNSIRHSTDGWIARAQVDASDRRSVTFSDGSRVETTCLLAGEFDVLAVNIFAIANEWRFVFAKNRELPRTTYKNYSPLQQQELLDTLVTITYPPKPPFYENPYDVLDDLLRERGK